MKDDKEDKGEIFYRTDALGFIFNIGLVVVVLVVLWLLAMIWPRTADSAPLPRPITKASTQVVRNQVDDPEFRVLSIRLVERLPNFDGEPVAGDTTYYRNGARIRLGGEAARDIARRRVEGLLVLQHERLHAVNYCATEEEVEVAAWQQANAVARRLGWRDRMTRREFLTFLPPGMDMRRIRHLMSVSQYERIRQVLQRDC